MHPQSVLHSMVEFTDGSTLAQASPPDMRLPIALALGWPDRVPAAAAAVDWTPRTPGSCARSTTRRSRPCGWPRRPAGPGACRPAIYNAANEECVAAFVAGRLPFLGIVDTLERVLEAAPDFAEPGTVEDVLAAESWARAQRPGQIMTAAGRSLMLYALGVAAFALAIFISVSLHEAGHMLTAKAFGMKVTRTSSASGRPSGLVPPRRDRVRPQGHPARRLLQDRRDDAAGRRRRAGRRAAGDVALPGLEADDRDVRRLGHPLRAGHRRASGSRPSSSACPTPTCRAPTPSSAPAGR